MLRLRRSSGRIAAFFALLVVASAAAKGLQPGTAATAARAVGAPVAYWVSPAYAHAGTDIPFTITFSGTNIEAGTVGQWDGVDQPSLRFGEITLDMTIQPAMVATPGDHTVRLRTGAEFSGAFTFSVIPGTNPPPVIDGMGSSSVAGPGTFGLFVRGRSFEAGARITVNGSPVNTRYLGESWLYAPGLAAPAPPATLVIGVTNPAPGGGNQIFSLNLSVQAPAVTPPPPIVGLGPTSVQAGSPGFLLTASLAGQAQLGTVVQLNGVDLDSALFESNMISGYVPASLVANTGILQIRLKGPAGNFSSAVDLVVNNTPAVAPPAPDNFSVFRQGIPPGQVYFFHSGGSRGAYMTIDGVAIPSTQRGSSFFAASMPASVFAQPGVRLVRIVNPAPGGGTSQPFEFQVYSNSDENCSGEVDAADALYLMQYLAGLDPAAERESCFPSNPDGLDGNTPTLADVVYIRREVANTN